MRKLSEKQLRELAAAVATSVDSNATKQAQDWTEYDAHDPGITTLELLAFLIESLSLTRSCIVSGLTVSVDSSSRSVHVSPGVALDSYGNEIRLQSTAAMLLPTHGKSLFVQLLAAETQMTSNLTSSLGASCNDLGGCKVILAPEICTDAVMLSWLNFTHNHWRVRHEFRHAKKNLGKPPKATKTTKEGSPSCSNIPKG